MLKFQKELMTALKASRTEIVLDTDAAELSVLACFDGKVKSAPWASAGDGGPLRLEHFSADARSDVIAQIARFAVEHGVDAVLSPGRFLRNGNQDEWFNVDRNSCIALRDALDREGGRRIAVDYTLIPTYSHLHDEATRGAFLSGINDLPFEFLWVRASGFGSDATPSRIRRYIAALRGLHNLGKPIIADNVGGLAGLAVLAFGAASCLAFGVGEHERFSAGQWDKPRKMNTDGRVGGPSTRIAIPGLDKSVKIKELELLAKARGGHRLVVCGDRNCCLHGLEDMIKNWRAHFLNQRFNRIRALEEVPDFSRIRYFLDTDMAQSDRLARQVKELKTGDDELTKRLVEHSLRTEKKRLVLENLYRALGDGAARAPAAMRGNVDAVDDSRGGT